MYSRIWSSLRRPWIWPRIWLRRSTASGAFESAIVWFWQTRQRSSSASAFSALDRRIGLATLGGLAEGGAAKASSSAASAASCVQLPMSGRIVFSSASGVIGPICL
jgi:hypothetical protein